MLGLSIAVMPAGVTAFGLEFLTVSQEASLVVDSPPERSSSSKEVSLLLESSSDFSSVSFSLLPRDSLAAGCIREDFIWVEVSEGAPPGTPSSTYLLPEFKSGALLRFEVCL